MKRFFGGLLMTVGALIASLSGACTMFMLVAMLAPRDFGAFPLILLFGSPAIALGIGLFIGGRILWKRGAPPTLPPTA